MMTRTVNQAVIGHKISEQEFIRVKDRFGEPELKSKEMYYISNQEYKSSNYSRVKLMIKLNKDSVSSDINNIRNNGQGLMGNNSEVNLSKTNLVTFEEYVDMFESYTSAILKG